MANSDQNSPNHINAEHRRAANADGPRRQHQRGLRQGRRADVHGQPVRVLLRAVGPVQLQRARLPGAAGMSERVWHLSLTHEYLRLVTAGASVKM